MAEFKRTEIKFSINSLQAIEFVHFLHDHIPMQHRTEEIITNNRSVYFDDDNFSLFSSSEINKKNNSKLRLRDYGYKNKYTNKTFLELKEKTDGITKKYRVNIPKTSISTLIDGNTSIIEKNSKPGKKQERTVEKLTNFITKGIYRPVLTTEYDRISFEAKEETKIRITVDRNIAYYFNDSNFSYRRFQKNKMHSMIKVYPFCIMETKIDNPEKTPQWLLDAIDDFELINLDFSKYREGIKSLLNHYQIKLNKS